MALFRKKKGREPSEAEEFKDDLDEADREYEDALLLGEIEQRERTDQHVKPPAPRPQGPWDVEDAPEPDASVPRIDLGALLVPVPPDTEVRVDLSPEQEVVSATLVQGPSSVQVSVFAAPRTEGIWDEVRAEIVESLVGSGGRADESLGEYGPELLATVPTQVPGQGVAMVPARFVGVDGPRWFLRAMFTGPAAVQAAAAEPLDLAVKNLVVVRGREPMAVRDALPLRLPVEVQQQAQEAALAAEQAGVPGQQAGQAGMSAGSDEPLTLPPPERGPETTETR